MITKTVNDLVKIIQEKSSQVLPNKSLLVAISGIDGSGKGYVTEKNSPKNQSKRPKSDRY